MWILINLIFTPIAYIAFLNLCFPNNNTSTDHSLVSSKFNNEEKDLLEKFRPMVIDLLEKDYEKQDSYLIRWIRANDFNLISAKANFFEVQKWRANNNMVTILNETIMEFKYPPIVTNGTDLEGSPIVFNTTPRHDIRKYVVHGLRDKLQRYTFQSLENVEVRIRELAKSTGKNISQATAIFDIQGYNFKQHACFQCIRLFSDWTIDSNKYFPELYKHMIFVNAPTIFKPLFGLVKGIMSKTSQRTIKLFGTEKKEWTKYLLNIISPDQLPTQFGGTKVLRLY